jgi:hypothetical protein
MGNVWAAGMVGRIAGIDITQFCPLRVEFVPGGYPSDYDNEWIGLRPEEVSRYEPTEEEVAKWMIGELSR